MPYRVKITGQNMAMSLLVGFIISWVITIVSALVVTAMLSKNTIPQDAIGTAAVITMFAASLISAIATGRMQHDKKLLACLMVGAIYYVSLLGCNALIFEGRYTGLLGGLLTIMGCSLIAGLLQTRQKQQRPSYLKRFRKI